LHYKMNEDEGCVRVCVEVLAGQLTSTDSVSFIFTAVPGTAGCKLIS